MFQSHLYLVVILLVATSNLVIASDSASNIRVKTAPPNSDYCMRCETDQACQAYAVGSSCKMGQCTNEDGLFGRNCDCSQNSDCASHRCDGIFQKTCMKRLSNGNMCYSATGCQSGYCNSFRLCADPPTQGETATEESSVEEIVTKESEEETNTEPSQEETKTSGQDIDIPRCIACYDNSECDVGGLCIEGFCADAAGVHPITCSTCRGDDDCTEGTFCHGFGLLGRSGKKCAEKRVNGASCSRSQACQSEHCNMLFRCDDRTSTKAPVAKSQSSGYASLAIWASVAVVLALFLYGARLSARGIAANATKRSTPKTTTGKLTTTTTTRATPWMWKTNLADQIRVFPFTSFSPKPRHLLHAT